MKDIIILLGIPGSGKGTQAKKIASEHEYAHISTGDLLRALDANEQADPEDKQKLADMKAGKLVSDDLIFKLAFEEITKQFESGKGVVLDGAIRSVEQAKRYQSFFETLGKEKEVCAIELRMRDEVSFDRMADRIAKNEGVGRADDNEDALRKRLEEQGNGALRPIAAFYEELDALHVLDGEKTIEEVEKQIAETLAK